MVKKRKMKRRSNNPNVPAMAQAMRRMKPKMKGGGATMMGPSGDITGTGATETPMKKKGKKKRGRR